MREYLLAAFAQIKRARLPRAHHHTARELLDYVGHDGRLELSTTEALAICGIGAVGTMRAHLIALSTAGILQYKIRCQQLYIKFSAWPNSDPIRAKIEDFAASNRAKIGENAGQAIPIRAKIGDIAEQADPIRAKTEEFAFSIRAKIEEFAEQAASNRAKTEENAEKTDQIRAKIEENDPVLPALGGTIGGVGWDLDPIPSLEEDQPTNPAPDGRNSEENQPTLDPVEQATSAALLIAAGVIPANAKRLATEHPFERVQRAVGHWYAGKGVTFQQTPGIVVTWLADWQKAGLPAELPAAFRRSDLYRRHRTRAQIASDAQMPGAPQHRQPPPPPRLEDPLAKLWAAISSTLPEGAQVYLRQAHLVSVADGRAQIAAPAPVVPWLRTQLGRRLVRDFALHGHEVQEVAIQEVGHASSG